MRCWNIKKPISLRTKEISSCAGNSTLPHSSWVQ
jgi:hypothetical protein